MRSVYFCGDNAGCLLKKVYTGLALLLISCASLDVSLNLPGPVCLCVNRAQTYLTCLTSGPLGAPDGLTRGWAGPHHVLIWETDQ